MKLSPEQLVFRRAQSADRDQLLQWRNDSLTRRNSLHSQPISQAEHYAWFERTMRDPNIIIWIVTYNDEKVGMVRAEANPKKLTDLADWELSWIVAAPFRGRGIGTASVSKAINRLSGNIAATIKHDNVASLKIAHQAGLKRALNRPACEVWTRPGTGREIALGIKCWSSNVTWFEEIAAMYDDNKFDFIELSARPGTFDPNLLRSIKAVPVQIHAPNENLLNLMQNWPANEELLAETRLFADFFESTYIIVHPGIGLTPTMAIAQIRQLQDPRIVIENVPKAPLSGGDSLFGYTPEMIQSLIDCTESKFCLDFVHAAKAALSQQEIFSDSLLQWIALKPSVFHLADTMLHNEFDEHLDLGAGEMNLPLCVDKILDSANPKIVLETPKRDCLSNDNLNLAVMRDLLHKAGYVFDR